MPNERVAIIGGGMTGLTLAYFLRRAGYAVTIIEKAPALSGLLGFTQVADELIERYYHHFFTHDEYQLALLDDLGLGEKILWRESRSAILHDDRLYPFVSKTDYLRLPFLSWATKIRGGLAALRIQRDEVTNLSANLTAADYLRRHFGEAGWKLMWEPLLVNKFGAVDAQRIPAQWIAQRIKIRASSTRNGREVLGYLDGSYRTLVDALVAAFRRDGGEIVLNTEVTTLRPTPHGGWKLNESEYDLVVSTIAPELIKRIVPSLTIPAVEYRAAICPLLTLKSAVTPYYWMNVLDRNVPFSVIVNQQALLPAGYYHGRWPLYIGHYVAGSSELLEKSPSELFAYYLGFLKKIWPGIEREIVDYEIGRTKYAQPVPRVPWRPLSQTTNLPNFFMTSMAHIYPEDRGVNYAIREAKRMATRLLERSAVSAGASRTLPTPETRGV